MTTSWLMTSSTKEPPQFVTVTTGESSNQYHSDHSSTKISGPFEVTEQISAPQRALRRRLAARALRIGLGNLANPSNHDNTSNDDQAELDEIVGEPPQRNYDCKNYDTCLDLAASLNWEGFTCGECAGEVNSALYWRAHQVQRKDAVAKMLCELKPLECHNSDKPTPSPVELTANCPSPKPDHEDI